MYTVVITVTDSEGQTASVDVRVEDVAHDPSDDRYDEGLEAGKQFCKDNPAECGISVSDGEYTQADLDATEQATKEDCLNDPSSCGIEMDDRYNEGYAAGKAECPDDPTNPDPDSCENSTLSSVLKFHIPEILYTPSGAAPMVLWADLEVYSNENGILLWKLGEYDLK